MAKCRIGHFVEAEILQALGVDCIDESEVLTPADEQFHVNKHGFEIPFVCGARDLGEALRRIGEGAAMIRSKGEAGTGNIVEAVRHLRAITDGIRRLTVLPEEELMSGGEEPRRAVRAGEGGARAGPAAGGALLRRRRGDARRCGAGDAAGRGWRLRRLGHLQVGGPAAPWQGDRQGDDALRGPEDPGGDLAGLGEPMRGLEIGTTPSAGADGGARLVGSPEFCSAEDAREREGTRR